VQTAAALGDKLPAWSLSLHAPGECLPESSDFLSVLHHLAASLLALAAFFGAFLHVLVVRELFALFRTLGTDICTRFANAFGEIAVPGHDLRRGRTNGRTV
jgi:hypothetical protein